MKRSTGVIIVGSGMGGLAAAITAKQLGVQVELLEKSDWVGGATAFSAGQAWVGANHVAEREGAPEDSREEVLTYVRALARSAPEHRDDAVTSEWVEAAPVAARYFEDLGAVEWRVVANYPDYYQDEPGAKPLGRYLTIEPFEGHRLGDWRRLLLDSPNFPIGYTYDEIFGWGGLSSRLQWDWDLLEERREQDILTFGQGLAAHFLHKVKELGISVRTGHRVVELLGDEKGVRGVRALGPDGEVEITGTVILATGAFDWNLELVREHLGVPADEVASAAPGTLTGDALALVEAVGGNIIDLPAAYAPRLPGYRVTPSYSEDNGWRQCMEHALPHTFLVNRRGRRFCDDSFHRDIVPAVLNDRDELGEPENLPMFMIWDEQHHAKYGMGATMPGSTYPEGLVEQADTLHALADKLGIDGQALAETATRFNEHAASGVDLDFGRGDNRSVQMYRGDTSHTPNANLGPVEKAPFFGMRIRLMSLAISSTGVGASLNAQVPTPEGEAIPGLYAVGNCVAWHFAGSGYNSGYPLSRAMTYGFLAAHHAVGKDWRTAVGA